MNRVIGGRSALAARLGLEVAHENMRLACVDRIAFPPPAVATVRSSKKYVLFPLDLPGRRRIPHFGYDLPSAEH
jgi:hypothetical protein